MWRLVGEICYASSSSAGYLSASDWGDALSFVTLVLLVALCFARRRVKVSLP